jgi:hypothetical protein
VSDSAAADIQDRPEETATPPVPPYEPVRVVPTRSDGWPDWLGRRPVSSADRGKILKDLQADQDELTSCCLTDDPQGNQDPRRRPWQG